MAITIKLWVFLLLLRRVASATTIEQQMYTVFTHAHPCVRLLNKTSTIGCATPVKGWEGVIRGARNDTELQSLLANPTSGEKVAVALSQHLFDRDTVFKLANTMELAGILVLHSDIKPKQFSPGPRVPSPSFKNGGVDHEWNPIGSGLNMDSFTFAIVALSNKESDIASQRADTNEQLIASAAYAYNYVQFKYSMDGQRNSVECLKDSTCQPLGGYSVWGGLGGFNASKEIVMVTSSMSSNAFFHEIAVGAEATMSGLIAMLAAIDALGRQAVVSKLKKQLVFAAFAAENWGYVGSRRFLEDIQNFQCVTGISNADGCGDPAMPSIVFKKIDLSKIRRLLDVNNVGLIQNDTVYLHRELVNGAADQDAFLTDIATAANLSALKVEIPDNTTHGLPPSSAIPFVNLLGNLSAAVLTDFDQHYQNPFTDSIYDTYDNSEGIFNPDIPGLPELKLCQASDLLARSLFLSAGGREAAAADVKVNCTLVRDLWTCLTKDFTCALVKKYLTTFKADQGSRNGDAVPHYTSTYYAYNEGSFDNIPLAYRTTGFVHAFLSAASTNYSGGGASVYYHNALDPEISPTGLMAPRYKIRNASASPLWTESDWPADLMTQTYRKENSTIVYAMFGAGVGVLVFSLIGIRRAKRACGKHFKTL